MAIPSADTIIEVDRRQHDPGDPAARRPAPRPDPAGVPRLGAPARRTTWPAQDPDFAATDDCTVVLRYLPDVPIWVVAGEERNMKVTDPIDVYLADKLFQLTSSDAARARTPTRSTAPRSTGKTIVVFGGSYGIGADIAALAARARRRPSRRSAAPAPTPTSSAATTSSPSPSRCIAEHGRIDFVVNTAGVLPRGSLLETTEETIYAATEVNYLAPVFIAQVFFPHLHRDRRQPAAVHLQLATPAAAAATASTPRRRRRWST